MEKLRAGGILNTRPSNTASYATLCVIMLTPSTPSFMSLLPSIALPIQGKYWNKPWKTLRTGWIWTHARRVTWFYHSVLRNDGFDKFHKFRFVTAVHCGAISEKVFADTHTEKVVTCWDLNPCCSSGRRYNCITRISLFPKYHKLSGVTANCRGSMNWKVLTRQLNGKTGIGWDLNKRPCNTAKVTLRYA